MKKILNLSLISLLFFSIVSCSDDDNKAIATGNSAPVLISPEDGSAVVLTEGLEDNTALTLVWNHGDYDVATEINYTVELALSGTDFATTFEGGKTTSRVLTLNVAQLNKIAIDAGIAPFEAGDLDIRVISSLGMNHDMPMVSNVLKVTVTPFEKEAPVEPVTPMLYFVGAPQGYYGTNAWTPENGIPMRYIGDGTTKVFEAYVKVNAGDGFKFTSALSWTEGNYGTIGGAQDGNLENSGGSSDIKVAETDGPGLYYVQVDIDNLKYKAVKMNWGIIGAATPGGWDGETAMTYDFDNNKFTITSTLTADEMKFRATNASQFIFGSSEAWKFNVGNSDPKTAWDQNAPNFSVTAGSHAIELSFTLAGIATVTGI